MIEVSHLTRRYGQLLAVELVSPSGEAQTLRLYLRSGKEAAP